MRVETPALLPMPAATGAILDWYDSHARALPWRLPPGSAARPDPWAVLLAEVMLQQTTVATVAPRYPLFLARWPTPDALAATPLDELRAAWAGLGYYARARNLHAAAQAIAARGSFPERCEDLVRLPGLGPYTAAAMAAIAFGEAVAVVDGNVARVAARLFALDLPPSRLKAAVAARLAPLVPRPRAGDFAQALMDLGATVCTPRAPACARCPLETHCQARAAGRQHELPARHPRGPRPGRRGRAWWIEAGGEVALVRRPPRGLLAGMLALPGSDWVERGALPGPPFPGPWRWSSGPVRHVFTHFALELEVAAVNLPVRRELPFAAIWTPRSRLSGLPTLYRKAAACAQSLLETGS